MISGIPVLAVPAFRNYTSFPVTLILIKGFGMCEYMRILARDNA